MPSLLGSVIDGRYQITAMIGHGGMARVVKARDLRLDRDVAVKLMHPHLGTQPDFTARFNREARAAARLSHPNVVAVYDQGTWVADDGDHSYLVMELVPGPDLRAELARLGSLNLDTAIDAMGQVLRALECAHSRGIIHRDVKPENVLLTAPLASQASLHHAHLHAKVADFGLARAATGTATTTGQAMGTIAYMAPELITDAQASAQSDLYAAGIMMWELLAGRLPFAGETPIATAYKHLNSAVPRLADEAAWIPEEIDSFIGLLVAKDPKDRPADAASALESLGTIARSLPEAMRFRRIPVFPTPAAQDARRHAVDGESEPAPVAPRISQTTAGGQARVAPTAVAPDLRHPVQVPPSAAPATTKRRRRRWWPILLTLLALVALAGGVAWYFLAGPGHRVTVPDVTGSTYSAAADTLALEGLMATRAQAYSDTVAKGLVISTDPAGGSSTNPSNPVTVTVSEGVEQVEVPSVVGQSSADAQEALRTSRLAVTVTEEYSETVGEGLVITQSLEAGSTVDHDSPITIAVSKGREPITVPSVVGAPTKEATSTLEAAGLTVATTEVYSDTVTKGTIISQEPSSGTLYRGDTVTLTVSKGPELVEVPNVIGMQESTAVQTLKDAGFDVNTKEILGGYFGTVRLQDPSAGTKVPKGSTITISII